MLGIQFKYATTSEILSSIAPFTTLDLMEKVYFVGLIFIIIMGTFYIIPFLFTSEVYIFSERERRKKKSMLKQIMTQKEIEDDVEREIREEEVRKQSATK